MPRKKKFRFTRKKRKNAKVLQAEKEAKLEDEKIKYLKEIYYSHTSPVAYEPFYRLFNYIKKNKGDQYTRNFVQTWLNSQDVYT